jgi:hypothetical protein
MNLKYTSIGCRRKVEKTEKAASSEGNNAKPFCRLEYWVEL